jgi:hypothetical protein
MMQVFLLGRGQNPSVAVVPRGLLPSFFDPGVWVHMNHMQGGSETVRFWQSRVRADRKRTRHF